MTPDQHQSWADATIARVAAVLALILGIALAVQTWRLHRADAREVAARAEAQGIALTLAGWQRAARASQAELAEQEFENERRELARHASRRNHRPERVSQARAVRRHSLLR